MMVRQKAFLFSVFFLFNSFLIYSAEIKIGNIRLDINKTNGRFSLFYLTDPQEEIYTPLFNKVEQNASFFEINADDKIYRLGRTRSLRPQITESGTDVILEYELPSLDVTVVFSPVRTFSANAENGVKITMTVHNKGDTFVSAGMRFLLDTNLNERYGGVPFETDTREIKNEAQIAGFFGDKYWINRGNNISLMGSIVNPIDANERAPDFIHIAYWRRLYMARWERSLSDGKRFNTRNNTTWDTAVCYYYKPLTLAAGESFTYIIFLTTEDTAWYNPPPIAPAQVTHTQQQAVIITERPTIDIVSLERAAVQEAQIYNEDPALLTLQKLQEILDRFLAGELYLNGQDLVEIERSMNRLRTSHQRQ